MYYLYEKRWRFQGKRLWLLGIYGPRCLQKSTKISHSLLLKRPLLLINIHTIPCRSLNRNEFENVTFKLASVLFGHQCVKTGEGTNRDSRVGTQHKSLASMYDRCYMTLSGVVQKYVFLFGLYWICIRIYIKTILFTGSATDSDFDSIVVKRRSSAVFWWTQGSFRVWAQPMRYDVTI